MIKTLKNTTKEIYNWTKDKVVRFKKWLVILILGAAVVAAPLVVPEPNKMSDKILSKEFNFNGKIIKTEYTDDNTNENLIIRTDKKTYGGWNGVDLYFSIENISDKTEMTDIQFYFEGEEMLTDISELKKEVPYQVIVNDYGVMDYECEKDWVETIGEMNETIYVCGEEIRHCDTIIGTTCTVDRAWTGNHEETRHKDHFYPLALQNNKVFTQEIPANLKAEKRAIYTIPKKEIKFFKATINFNPKSDGEFWIYAESLNNKGKLDPWYSSNYTYKKTVTIESDYVSVDTTFPVLVSVTDTDLRDNAKADGYDIIFVDTNNTTLLDFEIESWDNSTGELQAWVEVSISSSTDKVINMYYGNASATDISDMEGTWDANFKMVQHLQEDPTDTSPAFKDSTINSNDGTDYGTMTTGDQVAGKIDGSLDFDGGDDYVDLGTPSSLNVTSAITISAIVATDDPTSAITQFVLNRLNTNAGTVGLMKTYLDYWRAVIRLDGSEGTARTVDSNIFATSDLTNLVFTYDGSNLYLYVNGVKQTDSDGTAGTIDGDSFSKFYIGAHTNPTSYFNGTIDEVRIYNRALSANWITTEYNNQNAPSTFCVFGSEETDGAERRMFLTQ